MTNIRPLVRLYVDRGARRLARCRSRRALPGAHRRRSGEALGCVGPRWTSLAARRGSPNEDRGDRPSGYSEPAIAALVGHKGHSTTSRYLHAADAVLLAAADTVAQRTAELMGEP